jgi:uncharacterized protein DUF1707
MTSGPDLAADTQRETPQRCSDAEREHASSILRDAAAEGRLSMEELEERLSTIYAARYRHELTAVLADLPSATTPAAGWVAVVTVAWRQLTTDLAGLFGRGDTTLSRRRKIVLSLVLLAIAALAISFVVLLVHGMVDDGPEHDEFGGHEFGGE